MNQARVLAFLSDSGSVGISDKFLDRVCLTISQKVHWVHNNSVAYNTSSQLSGNGYFPAFKWNNSKDVFIFDTSLILTLSLDDLEYQDIEIKAIVHSIARIVITCKT